MVALFDRNGNGILSRDEYIDGVKALNLEIPLEKVRALANFLDKQDNGVIEVEEFINQIHKSVPNSVRGDFRMT